MKKTAMIAMCVALGVSLISCGGSKAKTSNANNDKRITAGSVAMAEMFSKLNIKISGRPTTDHKISDDLKKLPEIGLPMNPDLERIKALKTDVYVTSGTLQEIIGDRLKDSGLKVDYCDLDSYDGVKNSILKVAKTYGNEEDGKNLVEEINKKEKDIMKGIKDKPKKKVMILFGTPGHFMLASNKSFVGSVIEKLGAENIITKLNVRGQYIPFSLETALKENPDIIFRLYHGYIDEAMKQTNKEFKTNAQWQKFKAVRENKVYDLDPEYFGVTGDIKLTQSLEKMKNYLYE